MIMAEAISTSGDEFTDDDEDEEELDPRVHDELEKLNVAAKSINHLDAELEEARAVFRQTLAAATYHLENQSKRVGLKNVQKARPFYDVLRAMRKAHFELQKASHQYEKANSRHVCARQQVRDTENKMFFSEEKRAFDPAMQEMLNKATIEVNEAEAQKEESWLTHQKMYKAYQDVEKKAREMQSKLRNTIQKARPYFVQKVSFDRHLWQLKQRVDSIQEGLREAKVIYAKCLQSLEVISDDIRQKRKHRKSVALIANLQRRESGVGADSEDDVSLNQSQLDLDLDCEASLKDVEGVLAENLPEPVGALGETEARGLSSGSEAAEAVSTQMENMTMNSSSMETLDRCVSGAESPDSPGSVTSLSLKREVYGCENEDQSQEDRSDGDKTSELKQIVHQTTSDTNDASMVTGDLSERKSTESLTDTSSSSKSDSKIEGCVPTENAQEEHGDRESANFDDHPEESEAVKS